jgi:hypothetical protein
MAVKILASGQGSEKLLAKRLAVLADIHGNSLALKAVLADLEAQGGADHLINLGVWQSSARTRWAFSICFVTMNQLSMCVGIPTAT